MKPTDRLRDLDFETHNREIKPIWADINAFRKPRRIPIIMGTNSRFFVFNDQANPQRIGYDQYSEDPDLMFEMHLEFARWLRFNVLQDMELGLPEKWRIRPDFQNYYESAWFGCKVKYINGEVPDTEPDFADCPERVIENGIPDPFSGIGARAIEFFERYKELAKRRGDFHGRPIEIDVPMQNHDGVMTVACNLFGPEFVCMAMFEEPERLHKLLSFIIEGTIVRATAFRKLAGTPVPQDGYGFADDSIALISTEQYRQHILPHHKRLISAMATTKLPLAMHLCGDATRHFKTLRDELNVRNFDTGFPVDFGWLRKQVGPGVRIQGGPHVQLLLKESPQRVREEVKRILTSGVLEGGLFQLREGNNLAPGTPLENMEAMYHAGREYGRLENLN